MTETKTILIFSDWYYPGFKAGGPVQSVYNLSLFLSQFYNVKVVTRNTDLNDSTPYPHITPNIWTTVSDSLEVMYLSEEQINAKLIKSLIKENTRNVILINGLFSFKFSILPSLYALIFSSKSTFLAVRGMLHQSALSIKPVKKQIFLAFARGFGLFKNITLLASSEKEKEEIKKSLGKSKVKLAPNMPCPIALPSFKGKVEESKTVFLFLGRISPEKNPIMVLEAFKAIKSNCKVIFAGNADESSTYVKTFNEMRKNMPSHHEIEVLGNVGRDDLIQLWNKVDVMILPSLGENFGHSIFESFANSRPVIIGNNTPWIQIQSKNAGLEVMPNDSQSVINAIEFFINMPNIEFMEWQKGARSLANAYVENNNFKDIYLNLFS